MRTRSGSIEAYFHDGLGLGDDALPALRAALVEPGQPAGASR